jgi:hypothetical protein
VSYFVAAMLREAEPKRARADQVVQRSHCASAKRV